MVDTELAGSETFAAILAPVIVSCEEIAAVEAHTRLRHAIVAHEPNDARHLEWECHCPNEFVLLAPFQLPPQHAQFAPRTKVVVGELAVLDVDHLGDVAVKQAERPPDVDHVDGQIGAVEHEDAGLEGLTTLTTAQVGGCQTIGSRSSRLAEGDYLRTVQEKPGDMRHNGKRLVGTDKGGEVFPLISRHYATLILSRRSGGVKGGPRAKLRRLWRTHGGRPFSPGHRASKIR